MNEEPTLFFSTELEQTLKLSLAGSFLVFEKVHNVEADSYAEEWSQINVVGVRIVCNTSR